MKRLNTSIALYSSSLRFHLYHCWSHVTQVGEFRGRSHLVGGHPGPLGRNKPFQIAQKRDVPTIPTYEVNLLIHKNWDGLPIGLRLPTLHLLPPFGAHRMWPATCSRHQEPGDNRVDSVVFAPRIGGAKQSRKLKFAVAHGV